MWRADTAKKSKKKFEESVKVAAEFIPKPGNPTPLIVTPETGTLTGTDPTMPVTDPNNKTGITPTSGTGSSQTVPSYGDISSDPLADPLADPLPSSVDPTVAAKCDQASSTGNNSLVIKCARAADPEFPVELLASAEFHRQIYQATRGHSLGEVMQRQASAYPMSIEEQISFFTGSSLQVGTNLAELSRRVAAIGEPASFMNASVYNHSNYRRYAQAPDAPRAYSKHSTVRMSLFAQSNTSIPGSMTGYTSGQETSNRLVDGYLYTNDSNLFKQISQKYMQYVPRMEGGWTLPHNR